MKRTLKTLLAIAVMLTLTVAFAPFHASAVNGGTATFDCFLIVDASEAVPDVTFTYTIAKGDAVAADSGANPPTFGVSAGIGEPTITASVSFSNTDPGKNNEKTSVAEGDNITLASGQKYVKKAVTVDFSGVTFDEVGIYRYVITEAIDTSKTNDTVHGAVRYDTTTPENVVVYKTYDTVEDTTDDAVAHTVSTDTQVKAVGTPRTRYMDVCVTQGDTGLDTSYVLHEKNTLETVQNIGDNVTDKSTGIVNSVSSHNLTFGKEVTGNQGSRNQYFKFTLTLGGLKADERYVVNLTSAEASTTAGTNPGFIKAGDDSKITATFYLKDGQYIAIYGLPDDFTYALSEDNAGYTPTNGITAADNANNVAHGDPVASAENTTVKTSIRTGFTNNRTGIIPTGLLLTVTPFVVGLFLFGALFFYMMARKRKEY